MFLGWPLRGGAWLTRVQQGAAYIRFPRGPDVALALLGAPGTCISCLQLRQERSRNPMVVNAKSKLVILFF